MLSFIGDFVGGLTGAQDQADAAAAAGRTISRSLGQGISEIKGRFDDFEGLLSPFVDVGPDALSAIRGLLGLGGVESEREALEALEGSPIFQGLAREGENAILQNAAATGGLRGGNTQAALAKFRPGLLNEFLQQRLGSLGSLASLGQGTALAQGQAGLDVGNKIADLRLGQGQAIAGGQLAQGSVARQGISDLLSIGGTLAGAGVFDRKDKDGAQSRAF